MVFVLKCIIALGLAFIIGAFLYLWYQCLIARSVGLKIKFSQVLAMRLRGTNVSSVIKHSIGCKKEDVLLNPQEIESILHLGGDVEKVISTIIDAKKKGRDLSWKEILKEDKDKKFLRDDADKNVESTYGPPPENGVKEILYRDGKKKLFTHYKDGVRIKQESWYPNGQKHADFIFDNEKIVSATAWRENGDLCNKTNLQNGNGFVRQYDEVERKSVFIKYVDGEMDKNIFGIIARNSLLGKLFGWR